jgi:hypothetical protein
LQAGGRRFDPGRLHSGGGAPLKLLIAIALVAAPAFVVAGYASVHCLDGGGCGGSANAALTAPACLILPIAGTAAFGLREMRDQLLPAVPWRAVALGESLLLLLLLVLIAA